MTLDRSRLAGIAALVVGLATALFFAATFPAVEGLGTKVRLPVFHGAMTWVNLTAFSAMALLAVVALVTGKEWAYRWEEGLRWVSIPMWVIGSLLGLFAALNTWDFTGSKSSRLSVVTADPRLMAQFWILLLGLAVLAMGLLFDERKWLSAFDLGFVAVMWYVLLGAILGPGRALHPDSPVMNSEEIRIKLLFFGIVGGWALASVAASWLIKSWRSVTAAC